MDSSPPSDSPTPEQLRGTHVDGSPPRLPVSELEKALNYTFANRNLLLAALVHRSYLHEVPDFELGSNERLEFLGDAVLGLIVSSELFDRYPDRNEGQLSALRGALVRLNTLAEVAAPMRLGDYLYMSRGEEAAGGRVRASNQGRAVEAVLGAVYLDGGLAAAADVWHNILGERTLENLEAVLQADYKSQLQQLSQAHQLGTPSYRIVGATGPEHEKQFTVEVMVAGTVLGSGTGRNKQSAEQSAAQEAHEVLRKRLGNSPAGDNGTQGQQLDA